MKSLLVMAPFWDPYCPPLGIASLQASLKQRGRDVAIRDFNTDSQIWRGYLAYFQAYQQIVPASRGWNIMRLLPTYLCRHQMAWLSLRHRPQAYAELSRLILDIDGRQNLAAERLEPFDDLFKTLYARIDEMTDESLAAEQPDLVGCTLLATTLPASLHILRRAKERNPKVRTVLGGPGPVMGAGADSPDTQRILESCPWIDNIVIGEGEVLLDALQADALPRRCILSLHDVPQAGVVAVGGPGASSRITPQGLIADIGALPVPDYTGLSVKSYPRLSVGISRGCAYQCSFCYETTYWKRYRKRPAESALRDITTLRDRHGRTRFFLCDSLANFFAEDLSRALIDSGVEIQWDAYLRADAELLDPDYVSLLAEGGMLRARLGLESADDGILERMRKGISAETMGKALANLAAAGVETSTLWIVGFPGEDERAFQRSLDFLVEHRDSIYSADPWQFVFQPTVGSTPVSGRLVAEGSLEAHYGMKRLYPEEFDNALLVQHHELGIPGAVQMKIDRLARMCAVLDEAGIPNPYNMQQWRAADRRWRELHPPRARRVSVAVPSASAAQYKN